MFEFILLVGFLIVIQGVIVSAVLTLYTGVSFGESWGWTWSKPWVPIAFTLGSLLSSL